MAMRLPGGDVRRSAVRSLVDVSGRVLPAAVRPQPPLSRTDAARRAAHRTAMDVLLADPDEDPRVLPVVGADGNALHVLARGPVDATPIVLIHGWACSNRFWNPQVNLLSPDYRVITYDQRGHGRTPSGTAPAAMETLADDLSAVLRATVSPKRPAVIVGHSMGGMTVSAWAVRHTTEVAEYSRGLLLASTAADRLLHDFGVIPFPERLPGAFALGRAVLGAPLSAALLPGWGFHYLSMGSDATDAQVAFCREIVNACPPRNRGRWGTAMSELDVRAGLAAVTVPTTVMVGADDRLTPAVHARRMAEVLRAAGRLARLVELESVGHMLPVEAPFETADQIRALIG